MAILRCLLLALCLVCTPLAHAQGAAIASAHPLATEAGREVLLAGGNAFDAAVAVAAVLAVVEPYSAGLGGGGFFLLHRARDGRQVVVDARETAPGQATRARYLDRGGRPIPGATTEGASAAAIPGLPAALAHLARQYGRLSLQRSLAPAIHWAEKGFPVDERYRTMARLRFIALHRQPETTAQFLADGAVPEAGARLAQPALAKTLRLLAARGEAGFYRGRVAREMVRAVQAAGGHWTLDDLARYRVKERKPVVAHYRGLRIVSAPPPSAGGVALAESLNILSRYDLDGAPPAQRMHWVVEALRRAYYDRARFVGDPDFVPVPVARLTSARHADRWAAGIRDETATPSDSLGVAETAAGGTHTTHFSIVDAEGNRVAATLSINTPFGAAFVAGRTGVLLNNEMDDFSLGAGTANVYGLSDSPPNRLAPGRRPVSSMSPTFVEDDRGVLVLGTPGGSRIISMVLLAILGYAAQPAVDAQALVGAPRYHHQWLPDRIEVEPGAFPQDVLDDLQLRGHVVQAAERPWGNMQVVWVDRATGRAQAASDPRGRGAGLAWY